MAGTLLKALVAIAAGPAIIQSMMNMYPPFQAMVGRKAYKEHPDLIPTTEQMVTLRHRNQITTEEYTNMMSQGGLSPELSEELFSASQNYLTAFDYITLWRRGKMDDDELDIQLTILGFKPEQQERAKQATLYYPNPEDIVRFAVREVYTPEAVQKFGLDQDTPPEYMDAAAKGGLSPEFAQQFWRAHWLLPSPTQVYEMLHRGIVDEDEVQLYLRAADYMPYWRPKLTALSYKPLTRVDVRRMHRMGVLDREQVFKAYKDLGYDDTNAELMTLFTELYNRGNEGEQAQQPILDRYKRGMIDRAEAINLLSNVGIEVDNITLMLNGIDDEVREELIDIRANGIVDEYRAGLIDDTMLKTRLTQIGVPNNRLEQTIAREMVQAQSRTRQPSRSDIDRWLMFDIIDDLEWRRLMTNLKYDTVSIDRYFTELILEQQEKEFRPLTEAKFTKLFIEGLKTESELRDYLAEKGYSPDDIDDLVEQARLKIKE